MMKFILKEVKHGCRIGAILEMPVGVTDKCMDTPMCMLYTRLGSVPYLSRDVLNRIEGLPAMTSMPLSLVAEHHEAIGEFPGGVKKFCGVQDMVAYCSLQDPAVATPTGFNIKNVVSLWGRGGKYPVDVASHIKILKSLRADWVQCLCDSDTDANSTRKRVRKSVDFTLIYLDKILEEQGKCQELVSGLVGTIQGGYILEERLRSAQETAKRSVKGFAVEGLHNFGPETEKFNYENVKDLLQKTLKELPPELPRILPGVMHPGNLLLAIELGFDIFDSSYPYIVSERGSALSYSYTLPKTEESGDNSVLDRCWEIQVGTDKYGEDLTRLVEGCTCYTCTHHTRAYINHLLNVSELLARVLLNIHNLHHYLRTFEAIRHSIKDDTFTQLKEHILSQNAS